MQEDNYGETVRRQDDFRWQLYEGGLSAIVYGVILPQLFAV